MKESTQNKMDRCITAAVIACIGAYLLTFAVINFCGFPQLCDSDMYADTLIAKRMWEQKQLFPRGWIFSNQYFVIATPVWAALFYGLTGNVNTAMALATELMTALILVSFVWVLKAVTNDRLIQAAACLLLMTAVIAPDGQMLSWNAQLFFLQASYYACYLITMFVVFGDYIRAFQSGKRRPVAWGLALLLCFATGMQSLRQTAIMVLPILAYEIFLALRRLLLRQKAWERGNLGSLLRALSYFVANGAGFVTMKLLQVPESPLFENSRMTLAQHLNSIWCAICYITGLDFAFNEHYPLFYTILFLCLFALAAGAGLYWLAHLKEQEHGDLICWVLCLISIAGVLLASVLLNVALRHIYIFMWYPLVAFSLVILLRLLGRRPRLLVILLTCVLSLGNLYYSYLPTAQTALRQDSSDARQLCAWAMEEGYEYVYGDWFVAPRVAVHSGGDLEAGYWWETEMYVPMGYNIASDIYDAEENQKAIYVFTEHDEAQGILLAQQQGIPLTKAAEFGFYRAYTSPVPLMNGKINTIH